MLKKIPSDKINALCFFWRAPTHQNFTFNLQLLYELKHKVRLFKTVCGIVNFRFPFSIYQSLYFCSTKYMDSFTLKPHKSFQN